MFNKLNFTPTKCIFCKKSSTNSKTIEHIIPESLGNHEHILPPKIVCDACNNYFARKIEKPFLDSPYILQLRFRQEITNKRGLIPPLAAIFFEAGIVVNIDNNEFAIYPAKENEFDKFIRALETKEHGSFIFPAEPTKPDAYTTSRFIGKIAIEALVTRFVGISVSYEEIIENTDLDPLRNFVRYGDMSGQPWEYYERVIYDEDKIFLENNNHYQVLHEFTFLQTDKEETIFILAIFGTEYAISLDSRTIQGYKDWLKENDYKSPLYPD